MVFNYFHVYLFSGINNSINCPEEVSDREFSLPTGVPALTWSWVLSGCHVATLGVGEAWTLGTYGRLVALINLIGFQTSPGPLSVFGRMSQHSTGSSDGKCR